MSGARYVIQHFDFSDGGRSWHVYDSVERHHIHTATHGFLNEDNSEPICCTKICTALNAMEAECGTPSASDNSIKPKIAALATRLEKYSEGLGGSLMSNDAMSIVRDIYALNRDLLDKLGELETAVLAQRSDNSRVMQLPTLDECLDELEHLHERDIEINEICAVKDIYSFIIGRQQS